MSGYNGRRGPNVSQYVANLNTLPTNQDLLEEPLDLETDLSIFTNSDFIEWDPSGTDLSAPIDFLDSEQQQPPNRQPASNSRLSAVDEPKMDFSMTGKCLACLYVSMSRSHIFVLLLPSLFIVPSALRFAIGSSQGVADPAK